MEFCTKFETIDEMSEINDSSLTNGTDDCVFPKNHNLLNILQKGISENIEENIALKKETLKLFHNLHIEPEMLFNDIKESLEKASSILKCKGLLAMNATDLAISVETKKIQDKRKHREERNFALKYDTIFVKTNSLQKKHEQLQKAISSLEKIVANGDQSEETSDVTKILLKKKLKDYEYAVEELNKEIDKLQIQDLDPDVTMARYEEHLELMGKLAQLNEVIGQYKDLPPNLLQARALLETKQQEYEKIKDALEAELLNIRL